MKHLLDWIVVWSLIGVLALIGSVFVSIPCLVVLVVISVRDFMRHGKSKLNLRVTQ